MNNSPLGNDVENQQNTFTVETAPAQNNYSQTAQYNNNSTSTTAEDSFNTNQNGGGGGGNTNTNSSSLFNQLASGMK